MHSRWYYAGFNGHGIVKKETSSHHEQRSESTSTFRPLLTLDQKDADSAPELLFSCWSQLVFRRDDRLTILRHRATVITDPVVRDITSIHGTHDGMHGAVLRNGSMSLLTHSSPPKLHPAPTSPDAPHMLHVAIAGTLRVAAALATDPAQILEFASPTSLTAFLVSPTLHPPSATHIVPTSAGTITQLLATAHAFVALTATGHVYTWGDARHGALARPSTVATGLRAIHTPASEPGPLQISSGVAVQRIATSGCGGWSIAALDADGDVLLWTVPRPATAATGDRYVWDAERVGAEPAVVGVSALGSGSTAQVGRRRSTGSSSDLEGVLGEGGIGDVSNAASNDDDTMLRWKDVAVGDGHVVLRSTEGRVFVAGENACGQLGLGSGASAFVHDWVEVPGLAGRCEAVAAQGRGTCVLLREALDTADDAALTV